MSTVISSATSRSLAVGSLPLPRMDGFLHTASSPMGIRRRRMTCAQCAKAKRRCDKTSPSCLRCVEKGIACKYYPSRHNTHAFIAFANPEPVFERISASPLEKESDTAAVDTSIPRTFHPNGTYPPLLEPSSASRPNLLHADTPLTCRWFLSPASWTRQHGLNPQHGESDVSQKSLPHFIDKVKEWASTWVREGHSPIIHKQFYQDWMPECIEDAYTSLAAYHTASRKTKPTTLRIIESRANKLVSQARNDMPTIDGISPAFLLDTLTHLARTQALFIYQLIRLFDGDIRSRAQAERHMETLNTWCKQMVESAQLDCSAADLFVTATSLSTVGGNTASNSSSTSTNPFSLPEPAQTSPPSLHQAWLVSESIRRTFLAATFTQVVYNNLNQGWSDCPGGLAFTPQAGLWDAEGGYEWLRAAKGLRKEGGGSGDAGGGLSPWLMVQSLESWSILERAAPGEVDEFTVAVLEITYGVERVERWRYEKGAG